MKNNRYRVRDGLFSVCYKDLPRAGLPGTRKRYPAGDMEYGIMQKFARWFTQSKDRGTCMVKKETFECPMGSAVELDEKYAMRLLRCIICRIRRRVF